LLAAVLLCPLLGCADRVGEPTATPGRPVSPSEVAASSLPPGSSPATPDQTGTTKPADPPRVGPGDFDETRAMAAVRHLAGEIGSRPGTSPAYRRAAAWVADELARLGYDVERQAFPTPAGVSWGIAVPAGRSVNVVATPPGFDPTDPHLVVGAHLDTVPQAPGAEDNGSGIGVLLAAAAASAERRTRLPVVWVAFGSEEPRGPTDDDHHYGSRAFVADRARAQRRAVRAMVSLDRVRVGDVVPVGSATDSDPVQQSLLAAARSVGVPAVADPGQRSSDHWSFVRARLPAARLGSTPYAGYHSAGDVVDVVEPAQLRRTGRLLLAWLAPR